MLFLMIRRPPRSTLDRSSAASDVYKRQPHGKGDAVPVEDLSLDLRGRHRAPPGRGRLSRGDRAVALSWRSRSERGRKPAEEWTVALCGGWLYHGAGVG